jgi:hypothetical protein
MGPNGNTKSNRGGEGRNASPHSEDRPRPGKDAGGGPKSGPKSGTTSETEPSSHGVGQDLRGEDQPTDKSRARQMGTSESPGWKAQRDAALDQPQSPGEPAGHE